MDCTQRIVSQSISMSMGCAIQLFVLTKTTPMGLFIPSFFLQKITISHCSLASHYHKSILFFSAKYPNFSA